jgi:PAS domain S-box-containing protein
MPVASPHPSRRDGGKAPILLVDDRPGNLLALEAVLADLGQELVMAGSGEEALARLLDQDFAVILLDVKMPGLNGLETARLIRDRDRSRHTPIVFLTAYNDPNLLVVDAYALGAVDYLVKPVLPSILKSKVQVFVELFLKTERIKRQAEQLRAEERRRWETERLREEAARGKEVATTLQQKADELERLDREVQEEVRVRKRAEAATCAAEEQLRLMIDGIKEYALFSTDPAGRIATWNPGAEHILGYREAEVLGREGALFFTPEDVQSGAPEKELKQAAAAGRVEDERWYVRKDGSRFWASSVVTPLGDEAGQLRGYAKILRDNTERKRMEDELAASEDRFRSIVEQLPVLIWRTDAEGRYDYFNRPWYDFTGRRPEQEIGAGLGGTEGIHPDDRQGYVDTSRAAFARREPFAATFRLRRHDGQDRWVIDRGIPYYDPQGHFLGYLGSCLDITEVKGPEPLRA